MEAAILSKLMDMSGNLISGVASAGVGIVQSRKADKLSKEAEKLTPSAYDPRQLALLDDIKRKSKLLGAGKDAITSALRSDIKTTAAKATDTLVQGTQGNAGQLIEGLKNITRSTGESAARVSSVASDKTFQFTPMVMDLTNKIAERDFDIKMYSKVQKLREAAEMRKSANYNLSPAAGQAGSVAGESLVNM